MVIKNYESFEVWDGAAKLFIHKSLYLSDTVLISPVMFVLAADSFTDDLFSFISSLLENKSILFSTMFNSFRCCISSSSRFFTRGSLSIARGISTRLTSISKVKPLFKDCYYILNEITKHLVRMFCRNGLYCLFYAND